MKNKLIFAVLSLFFINCKGQVKEQVMEKKSTAASFQVVKTDAEWKKQLTPEQYDVLRNKGTERAFAGEYVDNFQKGKYVCAACQNVLFLSDSKFHSDCGWPSFDQAIKGSVDFVKDKSFGMDRVEVNCARCGGHLGHVFNDGPTKTGERFCTNSVSVKFIAEK